MNKTPINLITGFLGVGKTTALRHLLANRPAGERWAVIVNEFGEIGIDGAGKSTLLKTMIGAVSYTHLTLPTKRIV